MKKTIQDLRNMKKQGEKVTWLALYDYWLAACAEKAGIDMLLVGDSMGKVNYGYADTTAVTIDMSIDHCKAVRRGAPHTFLVGDMPFGAYHMEIGDTVRNAIRFVKEGRVDAVKLEGGKSIVEEIKAITRCGIVVFGHVGFTPQSSAFQRGFSSADPDIEMCRSIIEDAFAVYHAGAKVVLLQGVPDELAGFLRDAIPVPVYGLGAGDGCDGQVVQAADMLGFFENAKKKAVKRYAAFAQSAVQNFRLFASDVRACKFPAEDNYGHFTGKEKELRDLFAEYEEEEP